MVDLLSHVTASPIRDSGKSEKDIDICLQNIALRQNLYENI